MNSYTKRHHPEGLILYVTRKFADFGDTRELTEQLKLKKRECNNLERDMDYLQTERDKLKSENNFLKSMFKEILPKEDRKEVILELFENRKDDLDIDFEKLIKDEIKDYVGDAIKKKSDDENYYDYK